MLVAKCSRAGLPRCDYVGYGSWVCQKIISVPDRSNGTDKKPRFSDFGADQPPRMRKSVPDALLNAIGQDQA